MSIRSGLAALALACAGASPAFAQPAYQPPRTPDGRPDLQGTWTNASITTLERADRYKSTTLTPEEVLGVRTAVIAAAERELGAALR